MTIMNTESIAFSLIITLATACGYSSESKQESDHVCADSVNMWDIRNPQVVADKFSDSRIATDQRYREELMRIEDRIPSEIKVQAADIITQRFMIQDESPSTLIGTKTASIPASYYPINYCPTTGVPWYIDKGDTRCGSADRDGTLTFYWVPRAYDNPNGMYIVESSLAMYGVLCYRWGCRMTAFEITSGNTTKLCVGGPFGTAADGFGAALLLQPWTGLCGS